MVTIEGIGRALLGLSTYDYTGQQWKIVGEREAFDQWLETAEGCCVQDGHYKNGQFHRRFHIRLWKLGDRIVAGVHYENAMTFGGNRSLVEFHEAQLDRGKNMVCYQLREVARLVEPNGLRMENSTPGFSGSGLAAHIVW